MNATFNQESFHALTDSQTQRQEKINKLFKTEQVLSHDVSRQVILFLKKR